MKYSRRWITLFISALLAVSFCACEKKPKEVTVTLLATSDMHGMMVDWDYFFDEAVTAGSAARIASAVKQKRDANTIVIDAGDVVQGNSAQLFIEEPVHPMMECLNQIGYDIWVTGNHEYDYGPDTVRRLIGEFQGTTLSGNVYDPEGECIAGSWTVLEKDGVRIGFIGMTTPVIADTEVMKASGYRVSDPIEETKQAIAELEGKADILVGVFHMGRNHSISERDTSVYEVADACPELDVIIAAHEHKLVEQEERNGVLIVENPDRAKAMSEVTLTLEKSSDGWKLKDRTAASLSMSDYEPDPDILAQMADYDRRAKEDAETTIGYGFQLKEDVEFGPILSASGRSRETVFGEQLKAPKGYAADNAVVDIITRTMRFYSGADIAAITPSYQELPLLVKDITRCMVFRAVRYNNTIMVLQMTGAQLKKYMEFSAGWFQTMENDSDMIAKDETKKGRFYTVFQGLNYHINLAKPDGERITDLYFDGKPVQPDDVFTVAVTDFTASNDLLSESGLFKGEEKPTVVNSHVRPDLGGIQELVNDFIENTHHRKIELWCDENWEIVFEP